jgi:hypothetical protein
VPETIDPEAVTRVEVIDHVAGAFEGHPVVTTADLLSPTSRRLGGEMHLDFEILDERATSMGRITLRRRREPVLEVDVYEVKLPPTPAGSPKTHAAS